jgi:hypothetical protein
MSEKDFLLGFIAGEGTFCITKSKSKGNIYLRPKFAITLSNSDSELLEEAQNELDGLGSLYKHTEDSCQWVVRTKGDLEKFYEYIDSNTCELWSHSEKSHNFEIWKEAIDIYTNSKPTKENKLKIIDVAKRINEGKYSSADWESVEQKLKQQS